MSQYWLNVDLRMRSQVVHIEGGCGDVQRKGVGEYKPVGTIGRDGGWLPYDALDAAVLGSQSRPTFRPAAFCANCEKARPEFAAAVRTIPPLFAPVFQGFRAAKEALRKVPHPHDNSNPAVAAVRVQLPALIRQTVGARANATSYVVSGSVGEYPLNIAAIPWIAIFRKHVTQSARRGYYVVLLFAEDSASAVLSLNQGFFDFTREFKASAPKKARACASLASEILKAPTGFAKGPTNLNATGVLGKGYEQGAILSKTYLAGTPLSQTQFAADLSAILDAYDELYRVAGPSLFSLLPPTGDDEFQDNVQVEAADDDTPPTPGSVGPQPKPNTAVRQGRASYQRDSKVAARAIKMAAYTCALSVQSAPHPTFTANRTKQQYIEAHHLLPMSRQVDFDFSLDVEENVVPLCPTCHRLIHYGRREDKLPALKRLWTDRRTSLEERGLQVDLATLRKYYEALGDED
jgi:5-methylcytosine-specific restriction protein A